jgi:uncharacterized protein DUF6916
MYLTRGMFEENLNTRFWLVPEGVEPYAIDLVECVNGYSTPKQEQFSLRFRGDSSQVFAQRIYPIKHDSIGDFELFLVPVARDDSGTYYEAVFNRFVQVNQADAELQHRQHSR